MKIIQNSLYEIWSDTTDELLRIKGTAKEGHAEEVKSAWKEQGKEAWKLLMKSSHALKEDAEATAAFWLAWAKCDLTYEKIVEQVNQHQERFFKGQDVRKHSKEALTVEIIKYRVNDAREQIKKALDFELEVLKRRYARKR